METPPPSFEQCVLENGKMTSPPLRTISGQLSIQSSQDKKILQENEKNAKPTWGNSIEFLMSCIALSVGFGNIWRFPYTAYENGGGAFLIPYVFLLFLVGKPIYYLEMIIGQFSGKSFIKLWCISPALKGIGWAQLSSMTALATYYCALMAITLRYLLASFAWELPWAYCWEEWGSNCIPSGPGRKNATILNRSNATATYSSAQLYFTKEVLKEYDSIDSGIGWPDWKLALCLGLSWFAVCLIILRGIKSSGRASYFLAIFPYVILIALLVRALTLEGAMDGILFFVKPQFSMLLKPKVWYNAVTQSFFSLSVCFGSIISYSSHNKLTHNIYRDVMIITTLDTVTSIIAGCTIFGILGNLAKEVNAKDISQVVESGAALAFKSYPDAIAKFSYFPQFFALLFFTMLFVLGVGSAVGIAGSWIHTVKEMCPKMKQRHGAYATCFFGFLFGLVYVTPGGQFVLTLVDFYGASFVVFVIATFEVIGIIWIYGLENFLDDIEFMSKRKPSMYWRICWSILTPGLLIAIFIYTLLDMKPLTYSNKSLPAAAHAVGGIILAFGVLQIPLWMLVAIIRNRGSGLAKAIEAAFKPSKEFGPQGKGNKSEYENFKQSKQLIRSLRKSSKLKQWIHKVLNLEGC